MPSSRDEKFKNAFGWFVAFLIALIPLSFSSARAGFLKHPVRAADGTCKKIGLLCNRPSKFNDAGNADVD